MPYFDLPDKRTMHPFDKMIEARDAREDVLRRDVDEALMKENLIKCYGTRVTGFHVSAEHYRYLAEQIISLRVKLERSA